MSNATQRAVEIDDGPDPDDEDIVDQVDSDEAEEQGQQSTDTTDAEGSDAAGNEDNDGKDEAAGSDGTDEEVVVSIGEESLPSAEPAPEWVKQLRKDQVELRRRNRELEDKLQAAQGGAETKPATLPQKPRIEDFDYDAERFETAVDAWYEQKRQFETAEQAKREQQQAQERAWQEKLAGYQSAKSALKVRDYEDAEAFAQSALSVVQQGIIVTGADNPALVMYVLGKNHARAKDLAAISDPVKFAFAIAKLEKDLKVTSKPKSPPPPERTVSGHGRVASGGTDTTLEKLREEASRTGDHTKVIEYKRKLRDPKRG
jgi:hypothetical protein